MVAPTKITHCYNMLSPILTTFDCLFCSAVIEHTNKVIFLEDDDVAAVTADGG